jgi:hypothetical protein
MTEAAAETVLAEYRVAQDIAYEAGKVALHTYQHGYECGCREGLRRAATLLLGRPIND